MLRQTRQRVGGEDSKFNSFYYYCLIPEITNKVRYMMQQSHQTNYNEYRKKKRGCVNEYTISTFLRNVHIFKRIIGMQNFLPYTQKIQANYIFFGIFLFFFLLLKNCEKQF